MTMAHIKRSFAVSLHILHPSIDPAAISSALRLTPSRATRAGPPRRPPYDKAWWSYQFECAEVRDLAPFIETTVSSLKAHREFLRSVVDTGGSVELFCGIFLTANWDEMFPAALLASLADLGIDLRLDAYPEGQNKT